jgi:geranylgeranyl pyrophosphate synthase
MLRFCRVSHTVILTTSQLIDDILDFEGKTSLMGKPTLNDMKQGMATLPVLLAARHYPKEVNKLIGRKFNQTGDVEEAMEYVLKTNSIEQARVQAYQYGACAVASALQLPDSPYRSGLINVVEMTLKREK